MKILLGTHNPAKKKELAEALHSVLPSAHLLTLADLNISHDPEETGTTFEQNAKLKAEYYARSSKLPTIADDGGILIDALNGEPGVHSKRWLGYDAADEELIAHTLDRLKDVPMDKRTARFTVVLCYVNRATNNVFTISESIEGIIDTVPNKTWLRGFPYRALFRVLPFNKYYDDLTREEHTLINHRYKAMERLAQLIRNSEDQTV